MLQTSKTALIFLLLSSMTIHALKLIQTVTVVHLQCLDFGEYPIGKSCLLTFHLLNLNKFTACCNRFPLSPIFSSPRSDFDKIFVSINVLKSAILTRFLLLGRLDPFVDTESSCLSTDFCCWNGVSLRIALIGGSGTSI